MHPVFDDDNFKYIKEYIQNGWRPSTECAVIVTENAIVYPLLKTWFNEHKDDKISIGPYVGIHPYGGPFELETKTSEDEPMIEFLFLYEEIDKSKLTSVQLSLGRTDFIDIGGSSKSIH